MRFPFQIIYIVLGGACNLNCSYCIKDKRAYPSEINPEIYDFVRQIKTLSNELRCITFYGGEPTLYFDKIKTIIETLGDDYHYSTMTNGKAINEKMIDFFNSHDFAVNLSWDGHNSNITRGYDAIKENPNLLKINQLWLAPLITKHSYPMELYNDILQVEQEYVRLHGYSLRTFLNIAIGQKLDYERVEREMRQILPFYIEQDYVHRQYSDKCYSPYSRCKQGMELLTIDLAGNVYLCKNSYTKVGTVNSSYFDIVNKILANDVNMGNIEKCNTCDIKEHCKGGCRLCETNDDFCRAQKALMRPCIDYARGN